MPNNTLKPWYTGPGPREASTYRANKPSKNHLRGRRSRGGSVRNRQPRAVKREAGA